MDMLIINRNCPTDVTRVTDINDFECWLYNHRDALDNYNYYELGYHTAELVNDWPEDYYQRRKDMIDAVWA